MSSPSSPGPVGVVLAGGASRRMGRAKAALAFGNGTLLEWMIQLVLQAVPEVWVSVSRSRAGPPPRGAAGFLVDREVGAGPLAALRDALDRFGRPVLFVACDLPFLAPDDLHRLASSAGRARSPASIRILADAGGPQPLAAVYRPELLATIAALLADGRSAMQDLLAVAPFVTIRAASRAPGCPPLANLNQIEDYRAALAAARAHGLIAGD